MVGISSKDFRRIGRVSSVPFGTTRPIDPTWLAEMQSGAGIFIPMRTSTPGNTLRHWSIEGREAKKQREIVTAHLIVNRATLSAFPVRVTLTRYGPGKLPDWVNMGGMMKHVIDAIAKFYGVDDGDPRWQWDFQPPQRGKSWGVRIEITSILR